VDQEAEALILDEGPQSFVGAILLWKSWVDRILRR
jgi:hypothetical protein